MPYSLKKIIKPIRIFNQLFFWKWNFSVKNCILVMFNSHGNWKKIFQNNEMQFYYPPFPSKVISERKMDFGAFVG